MRRKWTVALSILLISSFAGCKKKKPQTTPPPEAQAPNAAAPAPEPAQPVPPSEQPGPSTQQATPAQQPSATTITTKPKTNHSNRPAKKTTTKTSEAKTTSTTKTVVPEGGSQPADNPDISVGTSQGEARHERQTTENLLAATESNLRRLNRALTSDEQAMVEEVKNYMAQARKAINDSDLIRANNLAMKAHLLSDALLKQ